jgi:CheY-like chemotaxis protein
MRSRETKDLAREYIALPILFEGQVRAVLELASLDNFSDIHLNFLEQLTESIGIVLNTIEANMRTENLLKQSQSLAKELQLQQEELTETNKRLEQQAKTLQASENLLTKQQEELQQTNQELEEKASLLATQNAEVEQKNREIEQARLSLEEKAEQLALTSKYKSEFLANMSHELRTPLNSLLILSKLLAENAEGNLTAKQVEFSRTVHSAGSELLMLINDILDLSKIESGTITVDLSDLLLSDLKDDLNRTFHQIAEDKRLDFSIEIDEEAGRSMYTDSKRLQQVLKNLLSNALKFTESGSVKLSIAPADAGWHGNHAMLGKAGRVLAFKIQDTGIGIAPNKQKIIFEAFQQADGTTSRKYGGTGLGLAISRELANLLGGEITVESELNHGSTFTFFVPQTHQQQNALTRTHKTLEYREVAPEPIAVVTKPDAVERREGNGNGSGHHHELVDIVDDRERIGPDDKVLLIMEDDPPFAKLLRDLARENGFKCLVTGGGETGLNLARKFVPDAITLDLWLSDLDGWTVLDRLKHESATRHIPVNIISVDDRRKLGLRLGAIGFLEKPVTAEALKEALDGMKAFIERPAKNLLVVEDDDATRGSIIALIGDSDVETTGVATGAEALGALNEKHYDCMVVDLGLPDMTGFELLERIKKSNIREDLPVVVYTGRELSKDEETELRRVAHAVIVKDAHSPERLLDETALFLHRVEANLPEPKKRLLEAAKQARPALANRKVLVVDDDVRNIFAITSVLERYDINVIYAENGRDGIELLKSTEGIDCVLMDVMMPELDGYETMTQIRREERFKDLPIIALTAKAMQGDREKCIAAGASDYISKPVDTEQLLSMIRVWVAR